MFKKLAIIVLGCATSMSSTSLEAMEPCNKYQWTINRLPSEFFDDAHNLSEAVKLLSLVSSASDDLSNDELKDIAQALQNRLLAEEKSFLLYQPIVNSWPSDVFNEANKLIEALLLLIRESTTSEELSKDEVKQISQALQIRLIVEGKSLCDIPRTYNYNTQKVGNILHCVAALGERNLLRVFIAAAGKYDWKLLHTYDADGRFPIHVAEKKLDATGWGSRCVSVAESSKWKNFESTLRGYTGFRFRPWYEDDFDSPQALRCRLMYRGLWQTSLENSIALFKEALEEYNKNLCNIRSVKGRTILHELADNTIFMKYCEFDFVIKVIKGAIGQDAYEQLVSIKDDSGKLAYLSSYGVFGDSSDDEY